MWGHTAAYGGSLAWILDEGYNSDLGDRKENERAIRGDLFCHQARRGSFFRPGIALKGNEARNDELPECEGEEPPGKSP